MVKCRTHLICVSLTQAVPRLLCKCILPNFTGKCRSKRRCQSAVSFLTIFPYVASLWTPARNKISLPAHINNGPLSHNHFLQHFSIGKSLAHNMHPVDCFVRYYRKQLFLFNYSSHFYNFCLYAININVSPVASSLNFFVVIVHIFFF